MRILECTASPQGLAVLRFEARLGGDIPIDRTAAHPCNGEGARNHKGLAMVDDRFGDVSKRLLTPDPAPDSLVARAGLLTIKGLQQVPRGMMNAVVDDIEHPMQTAGMVLGAAAIGAAVKTFLPKMGNYGKFAGLAIGGLLTLRAAEPIVDSYKIAANAKSLNDINAGAKVFGDVAGSFLVNNALSYGAYRLGGYGAQRYWNAGSPGFIKPLEVADPNVPVKPRWQTVVAGSLPTAFSISSASSTSMSFDQRLAGVEKFVPSERNGPDADLTGPIDGSSTMDVTVQLKSKATDEEMEKVLRDISLGKRPNMSDKEFAERFGASQESLDQVRRFAEAYHLKVTESDLRSGKVILSGKASDVADAFKTDINNYKGDDGSKFHDRAGALFVPKAVGKNIEGVFGIDQRPQARPRIGDSDPKAPGDSASSDDQKSFRPDEIANFYNFPKGLTGKGQGVAVIQLGGGVRMENEEAYYKENGLKVPDITVLELNGAKNKPGADQRADKEVSLDSQVLGSVAPDAKQTLIFTKNSEQGFIDAIGRASFPIDKDNINQIISISWGQPIDDWSAQGKRGMNLALKKAALRGISVFAAAGDDGAIDRPGKGPLTVDYPAADPFVTGVGGTRLVIKDGKVDSEVVWNDKHGSGGGGISSDELPEYQKNLKLPALAADAKPGRGVPDISANSSAMTAYKIRVRGQSDTAGGTSAAAPLYAALTARINEGLASTEKTVGFMNPFLYEQGLSGKALFFRDITTGHNNGYQATVGWDAASGWGSVDGEKLLQAYKDRNKS